MSSSHPRRTQPEPSPLAPGATFSDFCEARRSFFETLRRDSDLRRLEAAWDLPAAFPRRAADTQRGSPERPS